MWWRPSTIVPAARQRVARTSAASSMGRVRTSATADSTKPSMPRPNSRAAPRDASSTERNAIKKSAAGSAKSTTTASSGRLISGKAFKNCRLWPIVSWMPRVSSATR